MAADAPTTSDAPETIHGESSIPDSKNAYRVVSAGGMIVLIAIALLVASTVDVSAVLGGHALPAAGGEAYGAGATGLPVLALTAGVATLAMLPLCKPRPRRILDTVAATLRSIAIATAVIATLSYFTYTYRLPRATLLCFVGLLAVSVPPWFVALQQWQLKRNEGTLIVGNNPQRIEAAVQAAAKPVVGYAFSPTEVQMEGEERVGTDGGRPPVPDKLAQYECLGGLSRLDDILQHSSVGTVVPALPQTDRAEFFGVLETCHRHDVNVEILNEHNQSVLVEEEGAIPTERTKQLIGINMEPLDFQNRVTKRIFDVAFAGVALLLTLPLMVPIALAIKLDSSGPVFYRQVRTTQFGDTFPVYKFRSMQPESESAIPGEAEARITRVGSFLRRTHLDELPQLWSILTGKMSVVGPRAAWTEEEAVLQREMETWKKRWFVKPGLTGLAQINDVTSENSRAKLQYDLTYIRNQSFWFDAKIVVRQCWMVCTDLWSITARSVSRHVR